MSIRFACPTCHSVQQAADHQAGTKLPCTKCGQRLLVPGTPPAQEKTVLGEMLPPAPPPVPTTISAPCPGCERVIQVQPNEVALTFECARCGTKFVPSGGRSPSRALAPVEKARLVDDRPRRRRERDDDDEDDYGRPRRRRRGSFHCPYCDTDRAPIVRKKISTAGWVLFVVLLILCFPLCIIGLFITEDYRECSECGISIG